MENEWVVKLCSVGSYQVGKTSLIRRYAEKKFESSYIPTLGVDVTVKRILIKDKKVRVVLMDTAGQEQFGRLRNIYYTGSAGCIAVYDITRSETFEDLNKWVEDYRKVVGQEIPMVIVGNKIDLEDLRVVSTREGNSYAKEKQFPFYETSAKLGGDIIPEIYTQLVKRLIAKSD